MKNKFDLIVIGAGPSGLTACIYSLRNKKKVLLIEKDSLGGQMSTSPKIENYPGFQSISGEELTLKMFSQLEDYENFSFEIEEVLSIEKDTCFHVKCENTEFLSNAVIIATGVKHKMLPINIQDEIQSKISYCAVCDGAFYDNQDVAVIGDGNSALQYSLSLANNCKKVLLTIIGEKFYGDKKLVDKVLSKDNIVIIKNVILKQILQNDKKVCLVYNSTVDQTVQEIHVDGIFVAIGLIPDNQRFANLLKLDNEGYILADECSSGIDGLYIAGDVRRKKIRQITTAVSDGASAAVYACTYLDSLD